MGNILYNINDSFQFSIQAYIDGNLSLNSLLEDVENETQDRFFERKYRYSLDSINYTEWSILDLNNFEITGYADNIVFIDFIYTRKGNDTSGFLKFNSLEIMGEGIVQFNSYNKNFDLIFSDVLQKNFYTKSLRQNLLRKLYNSGILPKFIERGDGDDDDFLSFWGAICGFFSLISTFSNEFDEIPFNSEKLKEYLEQQNISTHRNSTLNQLKNISETLLQEYRFRGTAMTFQKDGENLGEWLRLISYEEKDDFLIDFERKKDNGYFLNQSSIIFPGTFSDNLQIEKYKNQFISIISEADIPDYIPIENLIRIEKDIDYIFEFTLNKTYTGNFYFNVGLATYNSSGFLVGNSLKNCKTQEFDNFFIKDRITCFKNTGKLVIRCVLFNSEYEYDENNELNIGFGNNLKQEDTIFKNVMPIITNYDFLEKVSVRPLVKGWNIKRQKNPQFLQSLKFVNNYRKNNNNDKDENYINNFLEKYLIPYHYKLNSIEIGYKKPEKEVVITPVEPPVYTEKRIFDEKFDNKFE